MVDALQRSVKFLGGTDNEDSGTSIVYASRYEALVREHWLVSFREGAGSFSGRPDYRCSVAGPPQRASSIGMQRVNRSSSFHFRQRMVFRSETIRADITGGSV